MAYAEANGRQLIEDAMLPPSEWLGGPTGLPGWVLIFGKGRRAIGYEWHGTSNRHDAGRLLLRALRNPDAPGPPTDA
jgi:hypothetical protein